LIKCLRAKGAAKRTIVEVMRGRARRTRLCSLHRPIRAMRAKCWTVHALQAAWCMRHALRDTQWCGPPAGFRDFLSAHTCRRWRSSRSATPRSSAAWSSMPTSSQTCPPHFRPPARPNGYSEYSQRGTPSTHRGYFEYSPTSACRSAARAAASPSLAARRARRRPACRAASQGGHSEYPSEYPGYPVSTHGVLGVPHGSTLSTPWEHSQ
jgi:hypothetical protein